MKRVIYPAVAILAGLLFLLTPWKAQAAAGGPQIEFTKSAASATANNSSKITFSVFTYYYTCVSGYNTGAETCSDGSTAQKKDPSKNNEFSIAVSGTGNNIGGTYTGSNGAQTIKTGDDGKVTFTLASSVAESKTVTIYYTEVNNPSHPQNPKLEVSFSAPAAPKKTTPPAPAPVEIKPPDAPATSTIEANGTTVAATDVIKIKTDESLALKGTTVANGVVKLYIFSTPREATVTADAQGNWSYAISGIEAGSHHVEAEVTDPTTGKTSARTTLASFAVEEPAAVTAAQQDEPKDNNLIWVLAGIMVVLLLAGGFAGWWFWKRKKEVNKSQVAQTPTKPEDTNPEPPENPQVQSGS